MSWAKLGGGGGGSDILERGNVCDVCLLSF